MAGFASPTLLPGEHTIPLFHRPERVLCTLTPKRANRKKVFRVLEPGNIDESARLPSPPRHKSVPLVGFLIERFLGKAATPVELAKKYGSVFCSDYFRGERMYVTDYAAVAGILRSPDLFTTRGGFEGLNAMMKNTLPSIDGAEHAKARSLITPAFSSKLFPYYFSFVERRARETWRKIHDATARGEKVKLDPVFREHYLSVTIEVTTGLDIDEMVKGGIRPLFLKLQYGLFMHRFGVLAKPFVQARDELLQILCDIVRDNLVRCRDVVERLRSYGDDLVRLSAREIRDGEVDVLLVAIATSPLSTEPGAELDNDVVEQLAYSVMLLWLAGYSTAAATSSSASLELGMNPEICAKLVAEQDALIQEANGVRTVTYHQVDFGMPLLDSYLSEILRLYPAVPGTFRIATQDMEMLGYCLPKGTKMLVSLEGANKDDSVYPQPEQFVMERFLANPKPPPVLSFGAPGSPHLCIGLFFAKTMMKTTFATLLREYKLGVDMNQSRAYRYIPEKCPKSGCIVTKLEKRSKK